MRRVVLIVPELVGTADEESALRQNLPAFRHLAEAGSVLRLAPVPPMETPEALYLGARPGEVNLRPGPLVVSHLGADPPERSLHFHLAPLSFADGHILDLHPLLPPEDLAAVMRLAERLNTRTLTLVPGQERDHGLVLELLGDLATKSPAEAVGKGLRESLPEGDHENPLRRFIDDSVNLLSELELNVRRADEGLPPLNLLWPWGHGPRQKVPNLALRRGEVATVESSSFRLSGLARLVGDQHPDRRTFGKGLGVRLRDLASRCLSRALSVIFVETLSDLRPDGDSRMEERFWFVRELDREFLEPLIESSHRDPIQVAVLAPGMAGHDGLGAIASFPSSEGGAYPFDERSLEERKLPRWDLDTAVRSAFEIS